MEHNLDFEAYYNAVLGQLLAPGRWDEALRYFRLPLPLVLRPLRGADPAAQSIFNRDLESCMQAIATEASTVGLRIPEMKWLEDWHAWEIKRVAGQDLQQWQGLTQLLYRSQKSGECTVQELTSMLPVLLLDPHPNDYVCDLCAAPGSKTLQILEAMFNHKAAGTASGFVIANELDWKRSHDLANRLNSSGHFLGSRLIVTHSNAVKFPSLFLCERIPSCTQTFDSANGKVHQSKAFDRQALCQGYELGVAIFNRVLAAEGSHTTSSKGFSSGKDSSPQKSCGSTKGEKKDEGNATWYYRRKLKFQRVLADVPCSGDGTLRKSQDIWADWSCTRGLANFPRQLAILRRALEVLQEGGRCVYSTCSLNPMENEAVVAAAVELHNTTKAQQGGGYVQVVDSRVVLDKVLSGIPKLAFESGLSSWFVPSPHFSAATPTLYSSWDEVPLHMRSRKSKGKRLEYDATQVEKTGDECRSLKLRQEMFPSAEVDTRRCIRLLPGHCMDGGGFFAAILTKVVDLEASHETLETRKDRNAGFQYWADCRFSLPRLKPRSREAPAIMNFFGMYSDEGTAAAHGVERFPLERLAWHPKRGRGSWDGTLVVSCVAALRLQHDKDLDPMDGGTPLLVRMENDCPWARFAGLAGNFFTWRPAPGSGAHLLSRCCTRRRLRLPLSMVRRLIIERRIPYADLVGAEGLEGCMEFGEQAELREVDNCVNDSSEDRSAAWSDSRLNPGGVIVVPEVQVQNTLVAAFAALLSPLELLILGSSDLRKRWIEILERVE